eukprot:11785745-Ditylum_brightwellii.AAC.1
MFTQDLLQWMITGKCKGKKVILGVTLTSHMSTSDMMKFCYYDELKLVDNLGDLSHESFSTTKTGKHCIDYMPISPELKKSGVYIDFDTNAFFGDDHVQLTSSLSKLASLARNTVKGDILTCGLYHLFKLNPKYILSKYTLLHSNVVQAQSKK